MKNEKKPIEKWAKENRAGLFYVPYDGKERVEALSEVNYLESLGWRLSDASPTDWGCEVELELPKEGGHQ